MLIVLGIVALCYGGPTACYRWASDTIAEDLGAEASARSSNERIADLAARHDLEVLEIRRGAGLEVGVMGMAEWRVLTTQAGGSVCRIVRIGPPLDIEPLDVCTSAPFDWSTRTPTPS